MTYRTILSRFILKLITYSVWISLAISHHLLCVIKSVGTMQVRSHAMTGPGVQCSLILFDLILVLHSTFMRLTSNFQPN